MSAASSGAAAPEARAPGPAPGSLRAWILAARPATLGAALVPVLVGTCVALVEGEPRWLLAFAAGLGATFIQIGTNLANDVFDYEKGADTEARVGPLRAVQAGLLRPRQVRAAMVLMFGLATVVGAFLALEAGWPIVLVGLLSIASGVAYTGGPYPLGYHGLGDLFVLAFFGFVAVCGAAFVQLGFVPALALWLSLPVGGLATAILVVNNVRDRHTDRRAGKRTLAVRLGKRGGLLEYGSMLALGFGVPAALALSRGPWLLLPLLCLPWGIGLLRSLARLEGAALNPILVSSAKLLVVHGVLLAAGLLLGG
ncbi:MAG: 1,4-dihydroxy-2-naphthoate polyprenyltransferase [Myxococcales bacterium]|nr:1,4-dihydroxy-2-naphthoate polyprenyltransferase [Myxococcales bacterium]